MSDATAIVMYSSPLCGFSAAAKRLLKKKGVEYTEISTLFDRERRDEMIALTGRRTVPQIFVGERHVGGYDELHALDVRGELDGLLASARRSATL